MTLPSHNKQAIEGEIKSLLVIYDEYRHKFGLKDEGVVGDFPGNKIEKTGNCNPI